VNVTALPPGAPACPIDGCGPPAGESSAGPLLSACAGAGEAPCGGVPATKCTELAVSLWSGHDDDHTVACVARMLGEACSLGDPSACGFAGRMWLDGRGVARDPTRGLDMLVRACDGGVRLACAVAVRWLAEAAHTHDNPSAPDLRRRLEAEHACLTSEADACYQVGLFFYFGESSCPRDRAMATRAYERGCALGDARACNNLGDALAYGEGTPRDVARAAALFDKACRLGEALGCANSGYMFEHGEGVSSDRPRARGLYRESCASGEVYGCLHADMLVATEAAASRDQRRALELWTAACDRRDARACAFVGVMYVDGPDGLARDSSKSLEAMNRACGLGEPRACEWVKAHPSD
jgi:TPR repeat protein